MGHFEYHGDEDLVKSNVGEHGSDFEYHGDEDLVKSSVREHDNSKATDTRVIVKNSLDNVTIFMIGQQE